MASFSGINFNGSANVLLKAVNKPPFIFMPNWQKSDVAKAVTQALTTGFTAVDTAAHSARYQEEIIGTAMRDAVENGIKRREDLFVRTETSKPQLDHELKYSRYKPNTCIHCV